MTTGALCITIGPPLTRPHRCSTRPKTRNGDPRYGLGKPRAYLWHPTRSRAKFSPVRITSFFCARIALETHGPLGTLWVSLGLGCFYIGLLWINLLLGHVLTPLVMLSASHLFGRKKSRPATDEA